MEGIKYDEKKLDYTLVPWEAMDEVVEVLMFGAEKYSANNWKKVTPHERYEKAALRHILTYIKGEKNDPESGLSHLSHAMCCLLFLKYWEIEEQSSVKHKYVYIASPYTLGDKEKNVIESLQVADSLLDAGYSPYAPLLTHYQAQNFPRPENDWLAHDIKWLKRCDCLLRLPGESKGADAEVAFAKENNIPVYYSLFELLGHDPYPLEEQ